MNTNPELEIFADDVQARHGATIGQLEEDQLFYLRSRGLDGETARRLLVLAFAGEVIDRIGVADVTDAVRERVSRRV